MRTDDTTKDSEETATTFTVSQSSHNSRTIKALVCKSTNQNPRERGKKPIEAVSFRCIATVTAGTDTHTQSALPYPSCGYASRHKYKSSHETFTSHLNHQLYTLFSRLLFPLGTKQTCLNAFNTAVLELQC